MHAHPDDESSKGSATYAHYRALGDEVLVVSCTGGEQGSILNEHLVPRARAERDIAGLRFDEMAAAQAVMDIDHVWLGYHDSGLPAEGEPVAVNSFSTIPLAISAEPLVRIIRRFKPQVLVTYDENGGYPHPDHIRTHEISMYAAEAAADPARYPDAGPAWEIAKIYYDRIMNASRMNAIKAQLELEEPDSEALLKMKDMMQRFEERPDPSTSRVDVSDSFAIRDRALLSHASQVAPDSFFFLWSIDLQARAWPTEDFQLVKATVETSLPETDLFAGISESSES
ncbi:mycothiol conjugate amidase Mca [Frondihabitans cladoniiphilus]|uniref:Mycothiol conjugate amidase Mca n=1 Tax=Frondihabitans cladoniiphilus TaxID=715785 RepID=A0ABP8VUU5_9MICO